MENQNLTEGLTQHVLNSFSHSFRGVWQINIPTETFQEISFGREQQGIIGTVNNLRDGGFLLPVNGKKPFGNQTWH